MNVKWTPKNFSEVVRQVHTDNGVVYGALVQATRVMGSLSCPAPNWDSDGTYRVGLVTNKLEIQRFDPSTKTWSAAPLEAPNA